MGITRQILASYFKHIWTTVMKEELLSELVPYWGMSPQQGQFLLPEAFPGWVANVFK